MTISVLGLILIYITITTGSTQLKPKLDGRIVGGQQINITDAPHQISLQTKYGHICGGSIIAAKWVLTAAHCTYGKTSDKLLIRAGTSTYRSGGEIAKIKNIIQHTKYEPYITDWDYSLLELEDELKLDDTKQPIKLPISNNDPLDGTICKVSGWGNTLNSNESRDVLRVAEVPLVNRDSCHKAYKRYGGITERMLCAGYVEGGKDSCQGDSGGPLVIDDMLIGIVSWGYGCAKPDYPGVYSRVSFVLDWITNSTKS